MCFLTGCGTVTTCYTAHPTHPFLSGLLQERLPPVETGKTEPVCLVSSCFKKPWPSDQIHTSWLLCRSRWLGDVLFWKQCSATASLVIQRNRSKLFYSRIALLTVGSLVPLLCGFVHFPKALADLPLPCLCPGHLCHPCCRVGPVGTLRHLQTRAGVSLGLD